MFSFYEFFFNILNTLMHCIEIPPPKKKSVDAESRTISDQKSH